MEVLRDLEDLEVEAQEVLGDLEVPEARAMEAPVASPEHSQCPAARS